LIYWGSGESQVKMPRGRQADPENTLGFRSKPEKQTAILSFVSILWRGREEERDRETEREKGD
jgi:hypothetical protein